MGCDGGEELVSWWFMVVCRWIRANAAEFITTQCLCIHLRLSLVYIVKYIAGPELLSYSTRIACMMFSMYYVYIYGVLLDYYSS